MTADRLPQASPRRLRNLREISPTVYFNVPKGFEMLAPHLRDDAQLRETFYRRLRAYFFAGASLAQHTWDELDAASISRARLPNADAVGPRRDGNGSFRDIHDACRWAAAASSGCRRREHWSSSRPSKKSSRFACAVPSVTPGYWRQPELTAQAFDAEGFYRLGDAVRLIDPRGSDARA